MKLFFILLTIIISKAYAVPVINSGEVKILYSCSIIDSLEKDKEEQELIEFYEKKGNELSRKGLIFRYQVKEDSDEIALKYRPHSGEIKVDADLYRELNNSSSGKLKCEADVNFDPVSPKITPSCAFEAPGNSLIPEHHSFLKMLSIAGANFQGLHSIPVQVTKWKLKVSGSISLAKRPSIEMWRFRNDCILEVSAKFEGMHKAMDALKHLKSLIPHEPSPVQGNKTGRVLQGH